MTVSPVPTFKETPGLVEIPHSRLDPRSDDEIIATLLRFQPVASEKNIWTFWDTGFSDLRPYVKRNIVGWVRRLGPDWTVRVLDHVEGSPCNVEAYLGPEEFHNAFNTRTMTGIYTGPHKGDVVRLPLLYHYGGVWLDAGTTLFRHMDDICWKVLEDTSTPYEIAGFAPGTVPTNEVIMNGFIASKKGNPFIKRWHAVYLAIWEGRTDCIGSQQHPLLRQVDKVQVPKDLCEKYGIDNDLMNDYVAHALAFKRVRMVQDPTDGWDGPAYWENHAFVLAVQETFLGQILCGFDGQRQYDLLALPRASQDPDAEHMVDQLLTNASTMKLSHGLKNNKMLHLSKIWDRPENADADIAAGTYAEYLRWGSVHLEQTRDIKPLLVTCTSPVLKTALLQTIE